MTTLQAALRPFRTHLVSVTITGGVTSSRIGSRWSVPKRDLIGATQVALQTRQLKIASALPTAQTLADELAAYKVTVSDDGRDSYGNGREAPNDDMVLALAIGTYVGTQRRTRTRITHSGSDDPPSQRGPFIPDTVILDTIFR